MTLNSALRTTKKEADMILVVGATGLLGSEICQLLVAGGEPVRALIRSSSDRTKVEKLRGLGVETFEGDLKNRSSLDAACHGMSAIISTASATLSRQECDTLQTVDREGQLSLIDAAKAAGVERFVLISFPNMNVEFPLQSAKREVQHVSEEQLRAQKEEATDSLQESFAGLMLGCAQGSVVDMREVLEKFPLQLRSVSEYAHGR